MDENAAEKAEAINCGVIHYQIDEPMETSKEHNSRISALVPAFQADRDTVEILVLMGAFSLTLPTLSFRGCKIWQIDFG